jgi:hypothetical protein
VLVRHPGDPAVASVVASYRSFLEAPDDTFCDWPLDVVVERSPARARPTTSTRIDAFRLRYLDLGGERRALQNQIACGWPRTITGDRAVTDLPRQSSVDHAAAHAPSRSSTPTPTAAREASVRAPSRHAGPAPSDVRLRRSHRRPSPRTRLGMHFVDRAP